MSSESSQTIALTRILLFDRPWQPSLLAELGLVARYRYRHGPGCKTREGGSPLPRSHLRFLP